MPKENMIRSIGIFFPCYNDEKTIGKLIDDAIEICKKHKIQDFKVLVIDDGSTDNSPKILENKKKEYPDHFDYKVHKKNLGYAPTIDEGLRSLENQWIFYTDGDYQYRLDDLKKFFEILTKNPNIELVQGYKTKRHDNIIRKIFGESYKRLLHFIFSLPIKDINCDYRMIKRDIYRNFKICSKSGGYGFNFAYEVKRLKVRLEEVPISHYKREYGSSSFFNLKNILNTILDVFRVLWCKKT